jgi:hypothetical protein
MTIQDQYTETLRQTQQTWTGAVQSLTDNVTKAFEPLTNALPTVDPNAAIDQVFDFWGKTLEVQREVAKQFVGITVSTGDKFKSQLESLVKTGQDQANEQF